MIKERQSGPLSRPERIPERTPDLPNIDLYGDLTFFSSLPPESQNADASARLALGSFKIEQKQSRLAGITASSARREAKPLSPPLTRSVAVNSVVVEKAAMVRHAKPADGASAAPAMKPAVAKMSARVEPAKAARPNSNELTCADCGAISHDHDLICIECGSFLG